MLGGEGDGALHCMVVAKPPLNFALALAIARLLSHPEPVPFLPPSIGFKLGDSRSGKAQG